MMDSLRCANPTWPTSSMPSSSGPRCRMTSAIALRAPAFGDPDHLHWPAIPHIDYALLVDEVRRQTSHIRLANNVRGSPPRHAACTFTANRTRSCLSRATEVSTPPSPGLSCTGNDGRVCAQAGLGLTVSVGAHTTTCAPPRQSPLIRLEKPGDLHFPTQVPAQSLVPQATHAVSTLSIIDKLEHEFRK